ncbi:hypothetical protein ACS0TY_006750 [Phlomoides rotata]
MSPNSMKNQFPSESFSLNNIELILLIVGLIEFFLIHLLNDSKRSPFFLFSGFQSQLTSSNDTEESVSESWRVLDQSSVNRGDVEVVIRSLGMSCNRDDEDKLPASVDADDLFNLFEEQNPSLDELKEAFDVFDENRDGFIDAKELHKVLCALRLTQASELQNCTKMIRMFDENGDGRVDFDEFVKFMEASLC